MAPERRPIVYQRRASSDIRAAFRWYEDQRSGLGEEFLAAIKEAEGQIVNFPYSAPVVHRTTRRVLLHRFPYGLYFRLDKATIVVVACYHGRRDPAGWKSRS